MYLELELGIADGAKIRVPIDNFAEIEHLKEVTNGIADFLIKIVIIFQIDFG
jgi:hypothetical protein